MASERLAPPHLKSTVGEQRASVPGPVRGRSTVLANTVSSQVVRLMLDAAELAGVGGPHLAHIDGLNRSLPSCSRTRIPTADLHRLWDVLHRTIGREAGVRVAATAEFGRLHVWDYLVRSAPTLAEGLHDAARFSSAIGDPSAVSRVIENGAQLMVTFIGPPHNEPVDVVNNEFALALLIRRAREAFGEAAIPVRVNFAHHSPPSHDYLISALGTDNIHFDQESDTITFLNCGRASGPHEHDPQLREILHLYAQTLIESARPAPTWLETFRTTLRETVSEKIGCGVTLDTVAHRLALSGRTLQRRLTEHHTTWRLELETARHELAVALLHDPDLPVQSIALQVGYRDHQTLARAFHRWTGQAPTTFRRSL
jgi:AraC-like DNA-binding protein